MKYFFTVLGLLLFTAPLCAQEIVTCTPQKSFWYIPDTAFNYCMSLPPDTRATDHPHVVMVNGLLLQYLILDAKKYVEEGEDINSTLPLIRHVTEESEYMTGQYKSDINLQMQLEAVAKDKTGIYWFFEVPGAGAAEVKKQHFLEIVYGDVIFAVAASQFEGQDPNDIKALLIKTLGSLVVIKDKGSICK